METIYIAIPSYEDPKIIETIEDAILKAKHPERLYFGIAIQHRRVPTPDMSKYEKTGKFKIIYHDVDSRPGVNRVRYNLMQLCEQDFVLLVDSHGNFSKDWDETLLSSYKELSLKHDKVMFTQRPMYRAGKVTPPSTDNVKWALREPKYVTTPEFCFNKQETPWYLLQLWHTKPGEETVYPSDQKFIKHHKASTSFVFAPKEWINEGGSNKITHNYEEEAYIGFASFLTGWNSFAFAHDLPVGQDGREYHLGVYGNSDLIVKGKFRWLGSKPEKYEYALAMDLCLLYNEGPLKISNAAHSPADFYKAVGIYKDYLETKNLFDLRYNELMRIANDYFEKKGLGK
jgi:hypothetical protein